MRKADKLLIGRLLSTFLLLAIIATLFAATVHLWITPIANEVSVNSQNTKDPLDGTEEAIDSLREAIDEILKLSRALTEKMDALIQEHTKPVNPTIHHKHIALLRETISKSKNYIVLSPGSSAYHLAQELCFLGHMMDTGATQIPTISGSVFSATESGIKLAEKGLDK